jgi:hypothetical protein
MIPGKTYLIHCGDWHTFVGRLVRQSGPLTFEFEQVSKVEDTNSGDNWHELAAGNTEARRRAAYLHYTTAVFLPLSIAAFEWVGDLPSRPEQPARRRPEAGS